MKQKCKACRKETKHDRMELYDGTKFLRCVECGQRPDRPKCGHKIKATCPKCGKRTTAIYFDDDGMDCYALQCDCGQMMAYDDLIQSQTKTHKDSMRIAQAMADTILNADHHLVGGRTVNSVTITVGSATATASRKA